MDQASRKRSRKSKLVPRECTEIEYVTDLQDEGKKGRGRGKRRNTNKDTNTQNDIDSETTDSPSSYTPREFSVTVAVEPFSEHDFKLEIKEERISEERELEQPISTVTQEILPVTFEAQSYILDRNKLLNTLDVIQTTSPNPADRELCLVVRHCLGHYATTYQDQFEVKIQATLENWQSWQRMLNVKLRSSPLTYKCYICEKSWWHLNDFREHLRLHDVFRVDLEEYSLCEANIIASSSVADTTGIKHFHTEGNCPKCGKSFEVHDIRNRVKDLYVCKVKGCNQGFQTCYTLRNHECTNHTVYQLTGAVVAAFKWKKSCEVCGVLFDTYDSYQEHMNVMHSVRSDAIIVSTSKRCQWCNMKYIHKSQHSCPKKGVYAECAVCFKSFSQRFLLDLHNRVNNQVYTCNICNVSMNRMCQKAEHLLMHTDNFLMMKRCLQCDEITVFKDDAAVMKHDVHMMQCEMQRILYFDKIIIPKSSLENDIMAPEDIPPIKEEPIEIEAPVLEIKQEIMDDLHDIHTDESIQVKQEIEIDDRPRPHSLYDHQYSIRIAEPTDTSAIFGIKIEPRDDSQYSQETQESEYEEDIIRLDIPECSLESIQDFSEDQPIFIYKDGERMPKIYKCGKCGFESRHKEYKDHIKSDCGDSYFGEGTYTCSKCHFSFNTLKKYISHFYRHGVKALSCPECFRTFENYGTLLPHVSMHIRMAFIRLKLITESNKVGVSKFQCKSCQEVVEKDAFFEHWDKHLTIVETNGPVNKGQEEFQKDYVHDAKAIEEGLLQKLIDCLLSPDHINKLRPGCIICHRHFTRRNDCKRHLIEHLLSDAYSRHPLFEALKCQICSEMFTKPYHYKKHMRDHGSLPIYECGICDKTFSDSSNYAKHKKLHNTNAFTCDTCGKKFQAKVSIEKHMMIHQTQQPITCTVCNKIFYMESAYKKHVRTFHERKESVYRCMVCMRHFMCLKDKWDHMWEVHKQRKYKADCKICCKSFRRFIDMKNHAKKEHHVFLSKKDKTNIRDTILNFMKK